MIHFNVPPFTGKEFEYMHEAVNNHKICGDGPFTKKCDEWMEKRFNARKVMLTTSGSSALDMAALLCGLQPGDEVIWFNWHEQFMKEMLIISLLIHGSLDNNRYVLCRNNSDSVHCPVCNWRIIVGLLLIRTTLPIFSDSINPNTPKSSW